jgi:hypothetical protein
MTGTDGDLRPRKGLHGHSSALLNTDRQQYSIKSLIACHEPQQGLDKKRNPLIVNSNVTLTCFIKKENRSLLSSQATAQDKEGSICT